MKNLKALYILPVIILFMFSCMPVKKAYIRYQYRNDFWVKNPEVKMDKNSSATLVHSPEGNVGCASGRQLRLRLLNNNHFGLTAGALAVRLPVFQTKMVLPGVSLEFLPFLIDYDPCIEIHSGVPVQ